MYATVRKWGNSQAVRLPKIFLSSTGIEENSRVEITKVGDCIQIRAVSQKKKHRNIIERVTSYYGKPIEEIGRLETEPEIDWGEPRGAEVW